MENYGLLRPVKENVINLREENCRISNTNTEKKCNNVFISSARLSAEELLKSLMTFKFLMSSLMFMHNKLCADKNIRFSCPVVMVTEYIRF